uniref:Major facilitator superfamily (MFS) profile domain-containing protein n=1 Tax=Bionectria ochroleuca TaxID=29856 RepID=A0A8H7MY76_BIOOC
MGHLIAEIVPAVAEEPLAIIGQTVSATAAGTTATHADLLASTAANDAIPPLKQARQWTIIGLIVLTNFFQFTCMFTTVAGGYEFSKRLGVEPGPGKANWMAAAYGLTQSAMVLISGRLGAVYGHNNSMFVGAASIALFSLTTAFCRTYDSFVAMRAMSGIGGGRLMPNAVATLMIMIPPGLTRNATLAVFAASPPVGALIGALLAGVFFWIRVIGNGFLFSLLMVATVIPLFCLLPKEEPVDKHGKIDFIGILLGLGGLILFSFAWNQAPASGWNTPYIIATAALSLVLLGAFFVWESRFAAEPIMPLKVFAAPTFTALIIVVLVTYMSVGIFLWYMVAWQQLIRGWTVLETAVGWVPFAVGASCAVALAAVLIPRLEAQWILCIGVLTSLASLILLATMPAQQLYWKQTFPAIFLASMCPDLVYVAAQIIASNSVGKREQGVAGSLIGTLNLYGNSLGLGIAGTIEVEVVRRGASELLGFRSALYFGAALTVIALILNLLFVRVPKDRNSEWKAEADNSA